MARAVARGQVGDERGTGNRAASDAACAVEIRDAILTEVAKSNRKLP